MNTIFCVEDDENIRELVCYTLSRTGNEAVGFGDAQSFFAAIEERLPDVVLLDIMLPDKDGMEILRTLRSSAATERLPIIMLTAKSGQVDKIKGLDSGADDYITKPFDIMELISRVNALLRRVSSEKPDVITFKKLKLKLSERLVTVDEKPVVLTYKEFELLQLLAENRGRVLTRDTLMNTIWGIDFKGESRTVDVHIRTLRHKLGEAAEYIETVRNVGYKLA